MSNFFLHNSSIASTNFDGFKSGIFKLIEVKKLPTHTFYKHDSVYSLSIIVNELYQAEFSQENQEIYRFLEQLSPLNEIIEREDQAQIFCGSDMNGFLGINFLGIPIAKSKQVVCRDTYKTWCFTFITDKKQLLLQTTLEPKSKEVNLSDHHGKKELKELCDRLKNSPFVVSMRSTNWGGKEFIRKVMDNGFIEIVLHKTDRQYALYVETTGRDYLETAAISEILRDKYDS